MVPFGTELGREATTHSLRLRPLLFLTGSLFRLTGSEDSAIP